MNFLSLFSPKFITAIVYMLQSTEYKVKPYLRWFWQTPDFSKVMYRRELDRTDKARSLLAIAWIIVFGQLVLAIWLFSVSSGASRLAVLGWIMLMPIITAHVILIPLIIGTAIVQRPREKKAIKQASAVFARFKGKKIVVLGSYGKTSTKELLASALSGKLDVAKTEENLNTKLALAGFANQLNGNEQVLIIELGEYSPGDIAEFARIVKPTHAVLTGLNSSHLDTLGTLDAAAENLLSIIDFVKPKQLFINEDSDKLGDYIKDLDYVGYGRKQVLGWKIEKPRTSLKGTGFTMIKGRSKMEISSGLLGLHNVPKLALSAALARSLGCTKKQTEQALKSTQPVDHRLQPHTVGGATILDDTYNGNIDGVIAATEFVKSLRIKFNRKIYVTPGLVEQGELTEENHILIGRAIAPVFDEVVLINNSVTKFIEQGLDYGKFAGKLTVVDNPLGFYQQLDQQLAKGDLVLMQNDWTDNYS